MNNYANTLGIRRNEMDTSLVRLFSHTNPDIAKDVNNKVLAFVNQIENERRTMKEELAMFKKNNEELIQRHNAAIASWDEERERALREADRVMEYKEKYEDLVKYIRFIGKQIPCNTGGTYENDSIDAILDAAVRALNAERLEIKYNKEAMTEHARKYFELYYKLQRCIDENTTQEKSNKLRQDIIEYYNNMTEKEKQLIHIIGIEHDKI